jgi:hypothetical protein
MKVFVLASTQQKLVLTDTAADYVETIQAAYGLPTFDAALLKVIRDHAKQSERKLREQANGAFTIKKQTA